MASADRWTWPDKKGRWGVPQALGSEFAIFAWMRRVGIGGGPLVSHAFAANSQPFPIAIKRQLPDANEKILAQHLAFAPLLQPASVILRDPRLQHQHQHQRGGQDEPESGVSRFCPAFAQHIGEAGTFPALALPRAAAAQALRLFQNRAACPSGMNSCGDSGSPNKCCPQGTYCAAVPDTDVGHVACCPNGSTCGGGVGTCPPDATSCPAALGGGCCIPGFVCQGVGCKKTALPDVTTRTTTQVVTPTSTEIDTITTTGSGTAAATATGNPPWRPTGPPETPSAPDSMPPTQTGCPTGFYGCLATHGGGCCRTDRDCRTYSCPAPSSTTVISDGVTIVIPATTDMPTSTESAACANGWFMCGADAGPLAGCCPSGYQCGTASCFTAGATETGKVQKQAPHQSSCSKRVEKLWNVSWSLAV
ncbi:hypothetical protein UVI_02026580 [Ustilaginoidea virens]|uniref:Uncharacterized protein n=1 Tax=Ustilaginoidea virens TaxID=1159556 RepID=A0A1B5L144_USTVR|nr:hypothetical protein UVI_02026580 [Ustilaginoidea virens]